MEQGRPLRVLLQEFAQLNIGEHRRITAHPQVVDFGATTAKCLLKLTGDGILVSHLKAFDEGISQDHQVITWAGGWETTEAV